MQNMILYAIAAIGLLGLTCQWIAWWLRLPAILFLLLVGILLGPVLGWLHPDVLFGNLLIPFIQLSVAIILFEGSLTLNFRQIPHQQKVVRNLITVGLLITATLTAIASHYIAHLPLKIAALFGAIVSVTGPTVIVPLLRSARPTANIATILRWEGILIDPIGAILAVLVFNFIALTQGNGTIASIIERFIELLIVSSVLGITAGHWLGVAMNRYFIPEYLHNMATLTVLLALYVVANHIDDGSGLLAVTLMGIWMANMREVHIENILGFKESLSILLISTLFILLAARIEFSHLQQIIVPALLLLFLIQFVIRPINVFISCLGSSLNWREKMLITWICPRGIVAASVAALFSIRLKKLGMSHYELLVLLTFLMIIGTVVFQSLTARLAARFFKVAEPEPHGFLIIGSNPLAIAIGKALQQLKFPVLLASQHHDSNLQAKLQGLKTYFGNAVSLHADQHLDLTGIGNLLALTGQRDVNTLACLRYRSEFGRNAVYAIQTEISSREAMAYTHEARVLFSREMTFDHLLSLLKQGAEIKTTPLTKNFDFKSFEIHHEYSAIPLFALDPKNHLHIFSDKNLFQATAQWLIISLVVEKGIPSSLAS